MEGWLNPNCTAEELAATSKRICEVYQSAAEKWEKERLRTLSVDEKTGMQALERNAPDLPMKPGQPKRQEYEYTRHGTLCLTANLDVVTGQIISPTLGETRQEGDFLQHIEQTTQSDPTAQKWCFVLDNLNTHRSESLVLWVAGKADIPLETLGQKGKTGILQSMETRAAFLSNPEHPVYFVYTPKHCSWLNQIEIWFSILSRKLLRRGNFTSKDNLKELVERFIQYFNRVLAKPYKWGYKGKPCSL